MSDNLRTRIAYAIAQADGDEPGMEPASCDYEMADAVIEALDRDYIIVKPGTPLAQKIVEWQWEKQDSKRPQITRSVDGSLRDRIAAVAEAHTAMGYDSDYGPNDQWVCDCGWTWTAGGTHGGHVADAVIRELNTNCIGHQIWNAAEWISVNSGWVPYEIHRNADGTGGGWRVTVQRIEADDE